MARTPAWTPPSTPFTLSHVAPLGVTREMVRAAVRSGRVTGLARGVFVATSALATEPAGQHLQRALAHQLRSPDSIASHATAALAWGLDLGDERTSAASPARFIRAPGPGVRATRTEHALTAVRPLPVHHRTAHPSGLVVTSRARTAVDVAGESSLPDALVVLDAFTRGELLDLVGERRVRDAHADERLLAGTRQPLLAAARSAATRTTRRWLGEVIPLADPRREAPSESLSYALFIEAGLPLPEMQVGIETPAGLAFPDFLWRGHRVIGEVDGAVKYTDPSVLVREKRRQEGFEQLGLLVVRWMADELQRRPAVVVQRIWSALERGAGQAVV